jgi:hypothetical protein
MCLRRFYHEWRECASSCNEYGKWLTGVASHRVTLPFQHFGALGRKELSDTAGEGYYRKPEGDVDPAHQLGLAGQNGGKDSVDGPWQRLYVRTLRSDSQTIQYQAFEQGQRKKPDVAVGCLFHVKTECLQGTFNLLGRETMLDVDCQIVMPAQPVI